MVKAKDNVSLLYVKTKMYGKEVYGMVDTGATLSAISRHTIEENGWENRLTRCQHRVTVADNRSVLITE